MSISTLLCLHVSNLSPCFKKMQETKVNMSNSVSVTFFSVAFGHKRGVASYRDRSQATGSKAQRGDTGSV